MNHNFLCEVYEQLSLLKTHIYVHGYDTIHTHTYDYNCHHSTVIEFLLFCTHKCIAETLNVQMFKGIANILLNYTLRSYHSDHLTWSKRMREEKIN